MAEVDPDVLVVGGGLAGLAAARVLHNNGISFKLLEARDRLGGRMFTKNLEGGSSGGVIEMGAQWIHGGMAANPLFNYAVKNKLLGDELKRDNAESTWFPGYFYDKGEVIDNYYKEAAVKIFEEIEEELLEGDSEVESELDLEIYFKELMKTKVQKLAKKEELESYDVKIINKCLHTMALEFQIYAGDNLTNVHPFVYGYGTELPGGDVVVPDGLSSIIKFIADELPPQAIRLDTKVTGIETRRDQVVVKTEKGEEFRSKFIIVALPLGVIKNNFSMFNPPLDSDKIHAMKNMNAGSLVKLFLEWDHPWWVQGEGLLHFARSKQETDKAVLPEDWNMFVNYINEVEGQPNMLVAWVSGSIAPRVAEEATDKEVLDTLTDLIREYTGDSQIDRPVRLHRHNWVTDPLTLGAYSSPGLGSTKEDYANLTLAMPSDEAPQLMLAGEYVHTKYWSFMHGAWASGVLQAEKIVKYMRAN